MTTTSAPKGSQDSRQHRPQPPKGLAGDINIRNAQGWFNVQADAIHGMDALHEIDIPASLTGVEREKFRDQKRTAFQALRDVALAAGPMYRMNADHAELKSDTTAVNNSIAEVDKAAKERVERRKGGK